MTVAKLAVNFFKTHKNIHSYYRMILKSIKTLMGLVLVLLSCEASANESMMSLYKSKNWQEVTEIYGPKYLTLSYSELILLSESYKNLKNYERQIKVLKHLDSKKPNYYKIHLAIAEASKAFVYAAIVQGQEYKHYQAALTDTIEFYRSAIGLNKKDITPYISLMKIFKDQENVPEGLALTKTMLAQFGEKPQIVLDLCEWNNKLGLVAQTQKACLAAAQMNPLTPTPLLNMAKSIRDAGDVDKYQTEIFKIYQKFPDSEDVIDLVGAIHFDNKDFVNAEKVLLKNKNSKLESSRINLVASLYENEKYDEALSYFSSSCALVNEQRKKLLKFFESRLRRLEINGQETTAFKFQKELNGCRATPVVIAQENKIKSSHFSEGIRLPSNARDLEGNTLQEKRFNYEQSRLKNAKPKDKPLPSTDVESP